MDFRAIDAAPQKTTATLTNPYGTYTVTVNESDLVITDMFDDVLIPLLQAAGYARGTIEGVIGEPADPPTLEHLYRPDFKDTLYKQNPCIAASERLAEVRQAVEGGSHKTRQFNDFMNRAPAPEHAEANRIKPL